MEMHDQMLYNVTCSDQMVIPVRANRVSTGGQPWTAATETFLVPPLIPFSKLDYISSCSSTVFACIAWSASMLQALCPR